MNTSTPILLGQYRPIDSYLHNLDARAKLLPVILLMVFALLSESILFYIVMITALITALRVSGITFGSMWRVMAPVLILGLLTAVFHLLFSGRGSEIIAMPVGFPIRLGALRAGGFYSLRLILFVASAYLITFTCSPSELAEAFIKCIKPLQYIRVPVNDLGLIVFVAIRFIPILYEEFTSIRRAQLMRGSDFTGSFITRIKKISYLLIPVFIAATSRADDLALAIESRGYDSSKRRTMYSHARFYVKEIIFIAITLTIMITFHLLTMPHHEQPQY